MKFRTGFVSNSSSSSFIILAKKGTPINSEQFLADVFTREFGERGMPPTFESRYIPVEDLVDVILKNERPWSDVFLDDTAVSEISNIVRRAHLSDNTVTQLGKEIEKHQQKMDEASKMAWNTNVVPNIKREYEYEYAKHMEFFNELQQSLKEHLANTYSVMFSEIGDESTLGAEVEHSTEWVHVLNSNNKIIGVVRRSNH
jgi:L-rhamnose mutarotase